MSTVYHTHHCRFAPLPLFIYVRSGANRTHGYDKTKRASSEQKFRIYLQYMFCLENFQVEINQTEVRTIRWLAFSSIIPIRGIAGDTWTVNCYVSRTLSFYCICLKYITVLNFKTPFLLLIKHWTFWNMDRPAWIKCDKMNTEN